MPARVPPVRHTVTATDDIMAAPRTRRFHPVLLLVIIVILAAIGHVVLGVFMPLLWIAFLGAAGLLATRHLRRPRPRQDR
jgi:hypothetical protein